MTASFMYTCIHVTVHWFNGSGFSVQVSGFGVSGFRVQVSGVELLVPDT